MRSYGKNLVLETRCFDIGFAELSAAAVTKTLDLFTLKAGSRVIGVRVKHSVAFAGTSITAMTVQTGITGTANAFTAAFDILQAVSDTALQETAMYEANTAAEVVVKALFTATGANTSALTAGKVTIEFTILNDLTDQPKH